MEDDNIEVKDIIIFLVVIGMIGLYAVFNQKSNNRVVKNPDINKHQRVERNETKEY